jgi:LIVCS family branched-chain amino acid:cation transporter
MVSQYFARLSKGKIKYWQCCLIAFGIAFIMDLLMFGGGGSGVMVIMQLTLPIIIIMMPIACVLIFLNLATDKIPNDNVYRAAVIVSGFVGACDYFGSGIYGYSLPFFSQIAGAINGSWNIFAPYGFGWIIPTAVACAVGWFIKYKGFEPRPYLRENAKQGDDEDAAIA